MPFRIVVCFFLNLDGASPEWTGVPSEISWVDYYANVSWFVSVGVGCEALLGEGCLAPHGRRSPLADHPHCLDSAVQCLSVDWRVPIDVMMGLSAPRRQGLVPIWNAC